MAFFVSEVAELPPILFQELGEGNLYRTQNWRVVRFVVLTPSA
jgi:hypothetical protein